MSAYKPLFAEKRCEHCGQWRGEHVGEPSNDDTMRCPTTFKPENTAAREMKACIEGSIRAYVAGEATALSYDLADPAITLERCHQLYAIRDVYRRLERDAQGIASYALSGKCPEVYR